jgi:biopolymer transport protein ExbD/biopolymer transport protein TolR
MGASALPPTRAKRPEPPAPEINVTPLVDVVLVLLIIFMVIAPALEHGERVDLPSVTQPDPKKSLEGAINVTITESGALFVEKEPMASLAALEAHLSGLRAADPARKLVLRADASLAYAKVRDAFAACARAGLAGVSLQVASRDGGEG